MPGTVREAPAKVKSQRAESRTSPRPPPKPLSRGVRAKLPTSGRTAPTCTASPRRSVPTKLCSNWRASTRAARKEASSPKAPSVRTARRSTPSSASSWRVSRPSSPAAAPAQHAWASASRGRTAAAIARTLHAKRRNEAVLDLALGDGDPKLPLAFHVEGHPTDPVAPPADFLDARRRRRAVVVVRHPGDHLDGQPLRRRLVLRADYGEVEVVAAHDQRLGDRRERGVEETILAHQFHGEGAVRLVLAACAPKEGGEKKAKSRHVTCSHGGPLLHVATARTQRGTLPRRFAAPTGPPAAAARREQPSRLVGDQSEVDLSARHVHAGQFHAHA